MRLRYRIWDTQEKRFHTPVYDASNGNLDDFFLMPTGDLVHRTKSGLTHESVFPDRYIVTYSTGLVDKHGMDIYGGDIVQYEAIGTRGIVTWVGNSPSFVIINPEKSGVFVIHEQWEIIGNMYEHPYLLEEVKHE